MQFLLSLSRKICCQLKNQVVFYINDLLSFSTLLNLVCQIWHHQYTKTTWLMMTGTQVFLTQCLPQNNLQLSAGGHWTLKTKYHLHLPSSTFFLQFTPTFGPPSLLPYLTLLNYTLTFKTVIYLLNFRINSSQK